MKISEHKRHEEPTMYATELKGNMFFSMFEDMFEKY